MQAYLRDMKSSHTDLPVGVSEEAKRMRQAEYDDLRQSKGSENPYGLAAELNETMWNYCGIWRLQDELISARAKLDELAERADQCNLLDAGNWSNQAVPFTRSLKHMIEMSKAIVGGAIVRDESRGAHFKLDTPERDDDKWLTTTKATWTAKGPEFDFSEKVECNTLSPRPRKYKINQNKVARFILGDDVLPKPKQTTSSE